MNNIIEACMRFWPSLSSRCGHMYLLDGFVAIPCCKERNDLPPPEHAPCDPKKCPVLTGKVSYKRRVASKPEGF